MSGRIVIIGAGHNGLVAAAYLARAGLSPLVLERRDVVGGAAITDELHPGFRCSTLAHTAMNLETRIVGDLGLEARGAVSIRPEVQLFAPNLDGPPVVLREDTSATSDGLRSLSTDDSAKYPEFLDSFQKVGAVLRPLLTMTPPDIDHPSAGSLWDMGMLGLRFRGLDKKDAFRLLRWGPMAVADLASEWFETELLRAVVEARGIYGTFAGPRSAGTSVGLLLQAAAGGSPIAPALFVRGGLGALSDALAQAARDGGAEIRTGVDVGTVRVEDGRAARVVLASGEEIEARLVVSNADPQTTFLGLVDPADLDPDFLTKIGNYRCRGTAAKVNLALSGLPDFAGVDRSDAQSILSGRIHIGNSTDYLERAFDAAKYGGYSRRPYLDVTIPSLTDPSLAPEGSHVMSIYVQFAPFSLKDGEWDSTKEALGDAVIATLSDYAPGLRDLILHRQVLTPQDLERTYGLAGGHPLHGEPSLDQLMTFRPLLGCARYRTPVRGLYLCGAGTHPGGGVSGAPGLNAAREIVDDLRTDAV